MHQRLDNGHQGGQPGSLAERAMWFRELARHPLRVASLAPSSSHLARRMADALPLEDARVVLELGAGTGGVTQAVIPRLQSGARFLALERSSALLKIWKHRYPEWQAVEGDVADLGEICSKHGVGKGDACCVVSGLPWASFPQWLQERALDHIADVMRPGGQMVTLGYHIGLMMPTGQRFLNMLPDRFAKVERLPWVWRNLPPAFVIRCTR